MNWLRKIITRFNKWFQRGHKLIYSDELPEKINKKTIYIIGNSKEPWLIAFNCPCGCQNLIQLNLLKDASPCWKFKVIKNNKINVFPSIWRTTGCRSHFFVRKSKINWVRTYKANKNSTSKSFSFFK